MIDLISSVTKDGLVVRTKDKTLSFTTQQLKDDAEGVNVILEDELCMGRVTVDEKRGIVSCCPWAQSINDSGVRVDGPGKHLLFEPKELEQDPKACATQIEESFGVKVTLDWPKRILRLEADE